MLDVEIHGTKHRQCHWCISLFVTVLLAQTNLQEVGATSAISNEFMLRDGTQLKASLVQWTWPVTSRMQCLTSCSSNAACLSVTWGASDNRCQGSSNESAANGIYSESLDLAENMVTYAKIRFPVVIYSGSAGYYTLLFNDAVALCVSMGTTIASPEALLQAWALGYHRCTCGWLSDGTNGFVLQHYVPGCWSYYATGFHLCGFGLAEVYCLT